MAFRHSLRLRILLAFILVALIPVGAVAFLVDRATTHEFETYSGERAVTDAQSVAHQASEQTGRSSAVLGPDQSVLAVANGSGSSPNAAEPAPILSSLTGTVDATSGIAAMSDSTSAISSEPGSSGFEAGATSISAVGGLVISLPMASDRTFLASVGRAIWIAAGLAAAGAVLLSLILTRQIVRPVESLTLAAKGMAAGDLRQRVIVTSQNEIGTLGRAFNSMAESRTRLDELRRNLVNDVAHELRTPLAALQGYLEVLRDGDAAPTPEVLGLLHEDSLLLSRLVSDLQELALAEAGELPLDRASVDVSDVMTKAVDSLRPLANARDVNLSCAAAEALPPAFADSARLSQVLRNLLRNAIAHTPPGGSIAADARIRGGWLEIGVRDNGVGIPAEHLPYVFDRFYRADPARSRATGGAGLGLAIVKNLVEAHGGSISVDSAPGKGSTFVFTLPLVDGALRIPAS